MEVETIERKEGKISDVGMLDLRYAKTPEDLAGITSISDVGAILIPEHLTGALARIGISDVGGVVAVPQDCKVSCMTGQVQLSAASLAAGDPDTILLIVGQVFILGEITSVGYKEVRAFGQIFAPRAGQDIFAAKLTQMTGQVIYVPSEPRIFMGDESIGGEYLDLLPEPTTVVVLGSLTFDASATKESVKKKLLEIVLLGTITAPQALVPLLQVLTKVKMGEIVAAG